MLAGLFSLSNNELFITKSLTIKDVNYSLGIELDFTPLYEKIRSSQFFIFSYIIITLLFLGTIGFFRMVKLLYKPVDNLIKLTDTIKLEDGTHFPEKSGTTQLNKLSLSLNKMVQRHAKDQADLSNSLKRQEMLNQQLITSQNNLLKTEKLAAIGQLSAGLAHEIGNPLGIVQGYIELLSDDSISPRDRTEFSKRSIDELNRIDILIRQLLDYSRSSSEKLNEQTSIQEVISNVVSLITVSLKKHSISIHLNLNYGDSDLVSIQENILHQIILNCLLNSIDAIADKGHKHSGAIAINADPFVENQLKFIKINIQDNGIGIPPDIIDKVFDPFFTTKDVGKGTGLGLAVSLSYVERQQGKIEIHSEVDVGTTVSLVLPVPL